MKPIFSFFLYSLLLYSCSEDPILNLNSPVVVSYNEKVRLSEDIDIEFFDVDDDRCYQEMCSSCFGSTALGYFKLFYNNQIDTIDIYIEGCNEGVDDCEVCSNVRSKEINGLKIGLLKLEPFPTLSNSPVPSNTLKATLKVLPN